MSQTPPSAYHHPSAPALACPLDRSAPARTCHLDRSEAEWRDPCIAERHQTPKPHRLRFTLWLASLLIFGWAVQAWGQGCVQCLDSTRATPPAVQAAYRHAIYLLGGTGALLFIIGTLIIRRER